MSLAAALSKKIYSGDGSTTAFPITVPLPAGSTGSDIQLSVVDNLGNVTVLGSNYNIDTVGLSVTYPVVGGVSPLAVGINALPSGWQLVLNRVEPLAQSLVLASQGIFDAKSIEGAFDKVVMMIQQLQEQINRCVIYPINVVPTAAMLNPTTLVLTVAPLLTNAPYAALKSQAATAPTKQFWAFATDLGANGQLVFYMGTTPDDTGFVLLGGS